MTPVAASRDESPLTPTRLTAQPQSSGLTARRRAGLTTAAKLPGEGDGCWHAERMQWHWGNIGSAVAGLSALVVAAAALIRGPAALSTWMAKQRAQEAAAREQEESARLDRRRLLNGWSGHGIDTFDVALVTADDELSKAADELASGEPTAYVMLRVAEGESSSANWARSLRQLIETEGSISRPPTTGEREALEAGLKALDVQRAAYG